MSQPTPSDRPIAFRQILFASNFSSTSASALPYSAAFARRFSARLLVLHVVAPDELLHSDPDRSENGLENVRRAAEIRIRNLLEAANSTDIPFRILIEQGEVAPVLAALVERENIDLVVAGSEGRHGFQKLLSPAIDEEIAVSARCPVLCVGPEVAPPVGRDLHFSRILHPTDFNPRSTPVIEYAYALAETFSSQIYFVHIADDVWKEPLSTRLTAEAFCRMRMLENRLPEHSPNLEPVFIVEFGPPEQLILETAERIGADLILMGVPASDHPALISHFPGPLAYDVASHARRPVLVLRNAAEPGGGAGQ